MSIHFIDLKTEFDGPEPWNQKEIVRLLIRGQHMKGLEFKELKQKAADDVGVKNARSLETDDFLWPLMAYEVGPGEAALATLVTATAQASALPSVVPDFAKITIRSTTSILSVLLRRTGPCGPCVCDMGFCSAGMRPSPSNGTQGMYEHPWPIR